MDKIFDHAVIYNGVLYPANTPIKVKEAKAADKAAEAPKKAAKGGAKNDSAAN